jgi:hypothetical protein
LSRLRLGIILSPRGGVLNGGNNLVAVDMIQDALANPRSDIGVQVSEGVAPGAITAVRHSGVALEASNRHIANLIGKRESVAAIESGKILNGGEDELEFHHGVLLA